MASLARRSQRSTNIWPGFVDALATLLMVIIFLLLIFVLAQFFLGQALSGRDEALRKLEGEVSELANLLSLEQAANKSLTEDLARLSAELKTSVSERDQLRTAVTELTTRAERAEGRVVDTLVSLEQSRDETSTARARISSLTTQAEADQAKIAAGEEALKTREKTLEERQAEIVLLLAKIKANQKQIAEGEKTLEDRDAEIEKLVADAEANRKTVAADKKTLAERQAQIDILLDQTLADRQAIIAARQNLEERDTEIARLTEQTDADRKRLAAAERTIAAAEKALQEQAEELARLVQDIQALRALKAELEGRIAELSSEAKAKGAALLAEQSLSSTARAQVALLNQQLQALREQLASLELALDASEKESEAQEAKIEALGKRLNVALASKVQELNRYRSEFFGRLREVLGNRPGIRVVGDRFVFQSEVLFDVGSAELGGAGAEQLTQLAATLSDLVARIPKDIDWVLRIDGHTDKTPIRTIRFPSNWELSAARAISVVKHLIALGLPPERLVAAGFGANRPIDTRNDTIAFLRNRRIELKLTQR